MRHVFPYFHFHALCFILVASAILAASIAIWAATSRCHWFWRALAMWLAAIAPIPMRGYELAGIVAITLPLIALAVVLLDRLPGRGSRRAESIAAVSTLRFQLRDVFVLTLFSALILAAFLHWWREIAKIASFTGQQWGAMLVQFALAGTAFWTLTVLAWLTFTGRRRILCGLTLVAAIATFAFAIPTVGRLTLFGIRFDSIPPWQALGITFRPGPLGPGPSILALVFTEFAIGLIATLTIAKRFSHSPAHPLTSSRRIVARILLAVPLIFFAIIYVKMIFLTPLPPRFSNESNNYDDVVEIMRQSERLAKPPISPASQQQISALVSQAAVTLQADNYIPYDPENDVKVHNRLNGAFVDQHNRLRLFSKRIDEEAAAALDRGDRGQALNYALANIRMGLMLQRGATYFDFMFGSHAHLLAQQRLAGLRRELSLDEARRVIAAIDLASSRAEDPVAVRVRSRAFHERVSSWPARLHHVIEDFDLGGFGMDDAIYLDAWYQRRGTTFRLLQTDLALRLYHHDHGCWPPSLDRLVPDYLPQAPIDPHSGRPFIYRPGSDDFHLYSVGKDGIDNGGRFTNAAAYSRAIGGSTENAGYDFDLDALIRP